MGARWDTVVELMRLVAEDIEASPRRASYGPLSVQPYRLDRAQAASTQVSVTDIGGTVEQDTWSGPSEVQTRDNYTVGITIETAHKGRQPLDALNLIEQIGDHVRDVVYGTALQQTLGQYEQRSALTAIDSIEGPTLIHTETGARGLLVYNIRIELEQPTRR